MKPNKTQKSPIISFRADKQFKEQLELYSKLKGTTATNYIVHAVRNQMQRDELLRTN